ncbi:MAG: CRISPR-associated helicase Cas3' [Gammaproteobacteria bacterium]|nr:CRISPR-associated helicase Cas3' [Gammaproteobacteria bacterium]MDE0273594.1 CRISPR-associated helicase Cas3' [Gammaproteobacteria bacterium]
MAAWGKYESPEHFHRLEHHCADVAACFAELVQDPIVMHRLGNAAGRALTETDIARLSVIAFLHDFGKLNVGFQFKVGSTESVKGWKPPKLSHIEEAFLAVRQPEIRNGLGLNDIAGWGSGAEPLLLASLSHHGHPVQEPEGNRDPRIWKPFAGYDPVQAAETLGERIRTWFPQAFLCGQPLPDTPALAHLFAGLVALADQLGSDKERFRFQPADCPNYLQVASKNAAEAVEKRGFRRAGRHGTDAQVPYAELFGHLTLRPLQQAVADAPVDHPLLILESETGSGKTEAAIIRFAALWRAGLVDGLYFALPTRAAAKQLHRRVNDALQRLFQDKEWGKVVLAVPGYIRFGVEDGVRAGPFDVIWDEPEEDKRLARWAAEAPRRYLGATAAVGTVDQALMAALKVKWAHLRGACLSRSLLVVDEVHASDAYMTELLRTLLRDHLQLGGHALLMSATLGSSARTAFTAKKNRFGLPSPADAEAIPYPAVTMAGRGSTATLAIERAAPPKTVAMQLEPWLADSVQIVRLALAEAEQGARVLVIRNTVRTARDAFSALLERGGADMSLSVNGVATLHHSRFAAEDRERLDAEVENALGKRCAKEARVVIGTQTLEQSLDIDADLLITDICPVDVLLQRVGRLHRHPDASRPPACTKPRCIVLAPEGGLEQGLRQGLLAHGLGASDRGGVYRNLLGVEQTRRLVLETGDWVIPDMNRMLVERGTHPNELQRLAEDLGGDWLAHVQRSHGVDAAEVGQAKEHALDRTAKFGETAFPNADERIATRLGEMGPRIVLEEPVPGPFGAEVRTFSLPAHLLGGKVAALSREQVENAKARHVAGTLTLFVGDLNFSYGATGLEENAKA